MINYQINKDILPIEALATSFNINNAYFFAKASELAYETEDMIEGISKNSVF